MVRKIKIIDGLLNRLRWMDLNIGYLLTVVEELGPIIFCGGERYLYEVTARDTMITIMYLCETVGQPRDELQCHSGIHYNLVVTNISCPVKKKNIST